MSTILTPEQIQKKEQEQIQKINTQLQTRAQKFGSTFTPITLQDYNMYKIKKASQTGNMQYLEGILLSDVADLQQRKRIIRQRTQKFFPSIKVQTDNDKFFNKRQNPDFTQDNTQIRYNAYYLFGVDYMSNERIRNYFHTNPHFKIQWINDSSCNISFATKEEAEEAVKPYIKGDSMRDQHQIWYELQEYEVDGVQRKLYCRLATTKDVKTEGTTGHESKYYKWQKSKKKINNYVKGRANQQLTKHKMIKKEVNQKSYIKKKEAQQHSSSGVDDSDQDKNKDLKLQVEQKQKEDHQMKQQP